MATTVPVVPGIYFLLLLVYLLALAVVAFSFGVLGAVLTLPVLYYTGYGVLPPRWNPALSETRFRVAAIIHLALGGALGICSVFLTYFVDQTVPPGVENEFANFALRLQSVPQLALGTGIVLALAWLGNAVLARRRPDGGPATSAASLMASGRVFVAFGVCFVAGLVFTSAIAFLFD